MAMWQLTSVDQKKVRKGRRRRVVVRGTFLGPVLPPGSNLYASRAGTDYEIPSTYFVIRSPHELWITVPVPRYAPRGWYDLSLGIFETPPTTITNAFRVTK